MGANYLTTSMGFFDTLIKYLIETFPTYQPILEDIYHENPFTSSRLNNTYNSIKSYFEAFFDFSEPIYGVQYIYDFIKDLTLAYNEFREEAFDLAAVCCPDMTRFPKHLMLGELCSSNADCEHSKYRNYFVASPALNNQQQKLEKVKFLHKRLVLMIESFSTERIRMNDEVEFKVTPSNEKKGFLSQRTIPFYYHSKQESGFPNLNTLESNWSYEIYRKCISSEFPQQLSYDNHDFKNKSEHPITTPLGFDLDQFNFFRIEGIQGKPVKEVLGGLKKLSREANLSFDIKPVYLGDLLENEMNDSCAFADLQPSYGIWRNKALLFFNNLVKANQNAEKVVLNRDKIVESGMESVSSYRDFDFASNEKRKSENEKDNTKKASSGFERKAAFNMNNISGMMSGVTAFNFESAAQEISKLNMNLGTVLTNAGASRSASFESNRDTSIRGLFSQLNTCLQELIKAMPNDFRKFDMQEWLKHYKCAMRMYIQVMKFLASETQSLGAMFIIYLILIVLCAMFRILRFVSIYPYITIRILNDTAQERLERLLESHKFSQFLRKHPGVDHKAGAAPGSTFVLVFQLKHEFEQFEKGFEKLEKLSRTFGDDKTPKPPPIEQILEVSSKMIDHVVADFTLPYVCCDDCGDMPHTPVTLDPLATPICGIAQFIIANRDEKSESDDALPLWDYKPVNIRILNDVYDPAVYKVRISDNNDEQPKFGTYSFEKGVYDPDNNKEAQIFKYIVDENLVAEEMKLNGDFFIIDEFKYEIVDIKRDEVVDSDLINIFIPVAPSQEKTTGNLKGRVVAFDGNDPYPIGNAKITIVETKQDTNSRDDGTYDFKNLETGTYDIECRAEGYSTDRESGKNFEIKEGENELSFTLNYALNVELDLNRTLKTMGIRPGTSDAVKVQNYVNTQMSDYRNIAKKLVEEEGSKEVTAISKAKDSVEVYSSGEKISVVRLNNDFNVRRNELVNGWDEASSKEKQLYEDTLKNLTSAYLDRLAYSQPDMLSKTTTATLKETASIFNSRKDLNMKDTLDNWNNNAQGFMSEDYRENVSKNLKLK